MNNKAVFSKKKIYKTNQNKKEQSVEYKKLTESLITTFFILRISIPVRNTTMRI